MMTIRKIIKGLCICLPLAVTQSSTTLAQNARAVVQESPFILRLTDLKGKVLLEGISPDKHENASFGILHDGVWDRIARVEPVRSSEGRKQYRGITVNEVPVEIEIRERRHEVSISIKTAARAEAIGYAFGLDEKEYLRGLGQRFTGLELRGQEIPTYDQRWTVPIPFFLSSRGYGCYLETTNQFVFDFGTRDPHVYSFWVHGQSITFSLIIAQTPKEIIKHYTAGVGRMMNPPTWQFGPWKWRDWVLDETEIYEDAILLQTLDIPTAVILIDSPWSPEYFDFSLNPKQFPNPKKMIDDLHRLGYRVVFWIVPFLNPGTKAFDIADRQRYLVKDSTGKTMLVEWWNPSGSSELGLGTERRGGMIDFTNPEAVRWWKGEVTKVVNLGIDGFKLDDGEHLPAEAHLWDGRLGYQVKDYPSLYHKAFYELMMEKRKGDFVLLPRAGWQGSQKYVSAFWAADQSPDFGDKTGLPSVIRGGQSIGIIGFPFWGSDVGGYQGSPRKEVFARWLQFGAFSPIMEVGGKSYHEPWAFDDDLLRIYRLYAQLHAALLPYITHYATEALQDGTPIIRSLFLEFPDDDEAYRQELSYFFGGELLVAPICTSGTSRPVYLPRGMWMDFWTSKITEGPTTIASYEAPLDRIPLFARISRETLTQLYQPLLREQVKSLRQRGELYLKGEKKTLLSQAADRFRSHLEEVVRSAPSIEGQYNAQSHRVFLSTIEQFQAYLSRSEQEGSVPFHVWRTIKERLDALSLSVRSILTLMEQRGVWE